MSWNPFRRPSQGSLPNGWTIVAYSEDNPLHTYQNKWTWPWPPAPAHEQRSALVNNWTGNQLPGLVNFIPGVNASYFVWNVPTSYMNTLLNKQYNAGFNIQGQGAIQNSLLEQQIQQAWQNRMGGV